MKHSMHQLDFENVRTATTSWFRSVATASRNRKQALVIALLLAVPVLAWTPTLGLLFWARLRLLTDLPRTAMATEAPETVAIVPPNVYPERPVVGFDIVSNRDPFQSMSDDSSNSNGDGSKTNGGPSSAANESENGRWSIAHRQEVEAMVHHLRLQALITGRAIAIINGRTYRVGEQLEDDATEGESFTLQTVGRDSVVIECDGVEFILRLAGGGAGGALDRFDAGGAS